MECVSSRTFSFETSSSTNGLSLRGSIPTGRRFRARSAPNVARGKHISQSLDCLRSSVFASSELRLSLLVRASELSRKKRLGISAAVGEDVVETEPATSINFATSLTVPGSSTELSFLGAGVREKQIAFLKVKVYAVGVYAEVQVRASLDSWKGKSTAELATDNAVYEELADAPVEKALRIVLARDVDGATFWAALDEALVPRLKAAGAGADGDKALAALGDVFRSRSLKKGFVITLAWVQPTFLKIALSESPSSPLNNEASIESKALLSALFDVFLGPNAVSPSAKLAVADGIRKLF